MLGKRWEIYKVWEDGIEKILALTTVDDGDEQTITITIT